MNKLLIAAGLAAAVAMAEVVLAKRIVEYPGVVDEKSGWRCVASEAVDNYANLGQGYFGFRLVRPAQMPAAE